MDPLFIRRHLLQSAWSLRAVEPGDQPFLLALFCASRPDLAGLPEPLLQMQFRAQTLSYGAQFPGMIDRIVLLQERAVGRLRTAELPEALRLVDIALLPEVRGNGLGTQLLQALQTRARELGHPIRLSVDPRNPAQHLYRRLGFVVTADEGTRLEMIWTPGDLNP